MKTALVIAGGIFALFILFLMLAQTALLRDAPRCAQWEVSHIHQAKTDGAWGKMTETGELPGVGQEPFAMKAYNDAILVYTKKCVD